MEDEETRPERIGSGVVRLVFLGLPPPMEVGRGGGIRPE